MATIGRSRAVAVVKGVRLQGRIAWWAWLVVHLVMLIGFRNRLVVLVNWAWNYFTYDRGLRAIVGEADEAAASRAGARRGRSPPRPPAPGGRRPRCGGRTTGPHRRTAHTVRRQLPSPPQKDE